MIDRAREHAAVIGVPMNIAVTDGGGHLLAWSSAKGSWSRISGSAGNCHQ
jgi:uncharacterized protein GlcG (DUF336 family)